MSKRAMTPPPDEEAPLSHPAKKLRLENYTDFIRAERRAIAKQYDDLIKEEGTMSSTFWQDSKAFLTKSLNLERIKYQHLQFAFHGTEEKWHHNERRRQISLQINVQSELLKRLELVAMGMPSGPLFVKFAWIELIRDEPKVDSSSIRATRTDLKQALVARSKVDGQDYWCPITQKYYSEKDMVTAYNVPNRFKKEDFLDVFKCNELHSLQNVMFMSKAAANRHTRGNFALVPNVDNTDDNSLQLLLWAVQDTKTYRIEVLRPYESDMKTAIRNPTSPDEECQLLGKTWNDLDGDVVTFEGQNEPRAVYVYYQYLLSVLRLRMSSMPVDIENPTTTATEASHAVEQPPEKGMIAWLAVTALIHASLLDNLAKFCGLIP